MELIIMRTSLDALERQKERTYVPRCVQLWICSAEPNL